MFNCPKLAQEGRIAPSLIRIILATFIVNEGHLNNCNATEEQRQAKGNKIHRRGKILALKLSFTIEDMHKRAIGCRA